MIHNPSIYIYTNILYVLCTIFPPEPPLPPAICRTPSHRTPGTPHRGHLQDDVLGAVDLRQGQDPFPQPVLPGIWRSGFRGQNPLEMVGNGWEIP